LLPQADRQRLILQAGVGAGLLSAYRRTTIRACRFLWPFTVRVVRMKLAEALLLRADLQKKLASLQSRVQKYVFVQEGEQPAEDPVAILRESDEVAEQLRRLVFVINRANLGNTIRSGETITEALATRDSLVSRHSILLSAIDACGRPPERYGVKEIRWVATVEVGKLQGQVDGLAKQIRELNASIQEAGWRVELEQ
jgi:hypothetical protein